MLPTTSATPLSNPTLRLSSKPFFVGELDLSGSVLSFIDWNFKFANE